jgi:hypothetical protein
MYMGRSQKSIHDGLTWYPKIQTRLTLSLPRKIPLPCPLYSTVSADNSWKLANKMKMEMAENHAWRSAIKFDYLYVRVQIDSGGSVFRKELVQIFDIVNCKVGRQNSKDWYLIVLPQVISQMKMRVTILTSIFQFSLQNPAYRDFCPWWES